MSKASEEGKVSWCTTYTYRDKESYYLSRTIIQPNPPWITTERRTCGKCRKRYANNDKVVIVLGTPRNVGNETVGKIAYRKIPVLFRGHANHCPPLFYKEIINKALGQPLNYKPANTAGAR